MVVCIKNCGKLIAEEKKMENDWKNNSNIYLQKHSHYYIWILYPSVVLFLGSVLFLTFGSSEQVVRSKAQLSAEHIATIQIPIEAIIKENKLKENLSVNKGDILLVFDVEDLIKQKEQLTSEINTLSEKNDELTLLIRSLEDEKNLFIQNDNFGYSNQVNIFLKSKEQIIQANEQIEKNYQHKLNNAEKNSSQLEEQIGKNQENLRELEQIRSAWTNQQEIQGYSTENMAKYNLWKIQMEQAEEMSKEQVKKTVITEIDQLIRQINQINDQLRLQKGAIDIPIAPIGEINSQLAIVDQTKQQQIATAKEQQKAFLVEKEKIGVTLGNIESELKNSELTASIDGTIHLESSYEETKTIPKGSVIAEIYSKNEKNQMEFVSQIPADEMTHIKKGMPIHMKIDKKGISEQPLDGYLTEISETSTSTEQGVFFAVKGVVATPKKTSLRYGLVGDLSLVIGKKTYWDQLIDFMFNKS